MGTTGLSLLISIVSNHCLVFSLPLPLYFLKPIFQVIDFFPPDTFILLPACIVIFISQMVSMLHFKSFLVDAILLHLLLCPVISPPEALLQ